MDKTVSLDEILEARDRRYENQHRLTHLYKRTLIVFTLNIPGNKKVSPKIRNAFEEGCRSIKLSLNQSNCSIIYEEVNYMKTGYEAYFIIDESIKTAKKLMLDIENDHPQGRLFDIDVFSKDMQQISREALGVSKRKCFICDQPAVNCSRSRRHSEQEIQVKLQELLDKCFNNTK